MAGRKEAAIETPEWARDAIFYQIFPDRFAHSPHIPKPSNLEPWDSPPTAHGFKGGDLLGIVEHLDYLQDLGITAIYLNPIFQSTANHRYHTHDYHRVDPILGGNEALRTLLDKAHRRDMRVMLDGVFNHASRGFFQFNHVVENGPASPYVDWFYVKQYPLQPYFAPKGQQGYEAWWDLPALPKLNVQTQAVRDFLWDVAAHWVEFGIDGWRLDVMSEIDDDEFWREFRRRVREANPEGYIVGEIWHDARRWLQGDQCDAVMNYLLPRACLGFFVGNNLRQTEVARSGYHQIDTLDAKQFATTIQQLLEFYPRPVTEVQFNLLGSHDTPRFKTLARGDNTAYRLSTLFQMTYPGTPSIYYGDEIGLEGGHDPACRGAFPWDERLWDHGLRDHVRRCIALRRDHPALRSGDFAWLLPTCTGAAGTGVPGRGAAGKLLAYRRRLGDEMLIVAINAGLQAERLDLPVPDLVEGTRLRDVWQGNEVVVSGGILQIELPARSGAVFQRLPSGQ